MEISKLNYVSGEAQDPESLATVCWISSQDNIILNNHKTIHAEYRHYAPEVGDDEGGEIITDVKQIDFLEVEGRGTMNDYYNLYEVTKEIDEDETRTEYMITMNL